MTESTVLQNRTFAAPDLSRAIPCDWDANDRWERFFDTYWKLIYGFSLTQGLDHSEAEWVVEETIHTAAYQLHHLEYDPSQSRFKPWLFKITQSKILDQFQQRASAQSNRPPPEPDDGPNDAENVWNREWDSNLMDAAIRHVKDRVPIEEYQIFDLLVLKRWSAKDVAHALRIRVMAAYWTKLRIERLIRKEFLRLETLSG